MGAADPVLLDRMAGYQDSLRDLVAEKDQALRDSL
jgi:hypothetical protein